MLQLIYWGWSDPFESKILLKKIIFWKKKIQKYSWSSEKSSSSTVNCIIAISLIDIERDVHNIIMMHKSFTRILSSYRLFTVGGGVKEERRRWFYADDNEKWIMRNYSELRGTRQCVQPLTMGRFISEDAMLYVKNSNGNFKIFLKLKIVLISSSYALKILLHILY